MYHNLKQLLLAAEKHGGLANAVLKNEMDQFGRSQKDVYDGLEARWQVMQAAALRALDAPQQMTGGLISGQAQKQQRYADAGGGLAGPLANRAMALALSCSEVNAAMGRVCAAPTAGACGVLPAVLITTSQALGSSHEEVLDALLVAGGVGAVITRNATVSGAEAGCQAECGAAAAMAAAAVVVLAGGTAPQAANAVALVLINCMGLVCDPVAGLVQMPCSYRNASQAVNALISADLALAGQDPLLPADEVIDAMLRVGRSLPPALRETAQGGIAAQPTARKTQEALHLNALPNGGCTDDA